MTAPENRSLVDAYCHVGEPRFGNAEDALRVQSIHGIERTVLVLGPMVPDFATLFAALQHYGDRVRGIGITFGESAGEYLECVELQVRAGVLGIRMWTGDLVRYPDAATLLGENGRWIYAVGPLADAASARALTDWLQRYGACHAVAPHFLGPGGLPVGSDETGSMRELLEHPRFHPVFSRQGAVGSRRPYPHDDLRPWVEQTLELTGWDRVMWGSEYPVLYWRNETIEAGINWLRDLGLSASDRDIAKFLADNARRDIFAVPAPERERVEIPPWIGRQFNQKRTVPLFPNNPIELPMDLYSRLHHEYVAELGEDASLPFSSFIVNKLRQSVVR